MPCAGASPAGYHLADNRVWVGQDITVHRHAEVHSMISGRRRARIRVVDAVASIPRPIEEAIINLPFDELARRGMFEGNRESPP